jgi:dihydropteroate synthase
MALLFGLVSGMIKEGEVMKNSSEIDYSYSEPKRQPRNWHCCGREIPLGRRTLVMGILNVTPDSFSDGGDFCDPVRAIEQAWRIAEEGADILDVGGMSSRPGSGEISEGEELERVVPVLDSLRQKYPLPISIDTYRAKVARAALERGAEIVNDITALRGDPALAGLVAEFGAGLILMHMRGTPRTMQLDVEYEDMPGEISQFLQDRILAAEKAGIPPESIVTDPGIGFGKSAQGNLELIRSTGFFRGRASGVLMGPSRKSFLGKTLGGIGPRERVWATASAVALCIQAGADIVRVHDVGPMVQVCRVADAIVRVDRGEAI